MTAIMDDILIFGRTRKEHDTNLRNVLDRARNMGIRFNSDKMAINVKQVPFFDHVITDKGLQAGNSKVEAIMKLDIPDTCEKFERFLGMVNYICKFASNLAEITSPLRNLLKRRLNSFGTNRKPEHLRKLKKLLHKVQYCVTLTLRKPSRLRWMRQNLGSELALSNAEGLLRLRHRV